MEKAERQSKAAMVFRLARITFSNVWSGNQARVCGLAARKSHRKPGLLFGSYLEDHVICCAIFFAG
jgi:hypothetical protein